MVAARVRPLLLEPLGALALCRSLQAAAFGCSTLAGNQRRHSSPRLMPGCCYQSQHPVAALSNTTQRVRYPPIAPGCCSQPALQSASPLSVLGSLPIAPGAGRCSQLQHSLLPSATPVSVLAIRRSRQAVDSSAALFAVISNPTQRVRLAADHARLLLLAADLPAAISITTQHAGR